MKILVTILVLPLFLTIQSLAAICSTQCELDKLPGVVSEDSAPEHQSCHQPSSDEEAPSDDREKGCASKVCQFGEIIKSDAVKINGEIQGQVLTFLKIENSIAESASLHLSMVFSTGPPGIINFFKIPLYISKASYII